MKIDELRFYELLQKEKEKDAILLENEKKRFARLIKSCGEESINYTNLIKKPNRFKIFWRKLGILWNKIIWSV